MKRFFTALLLCFQAAALFSSDNIIAFREMDVNIGARAQAMANAYTAAVDDSTSVFWNPAGLSKMKNMDATASYSSWFVDTSIQYVTGAVNTAKSSGFGAGIVFINMGEIEFIDDAGFVSGQTLRPFSLILSAGYGARTFDYYGDIMRNKPDFSLSAGFSAKTILNSDGEDFSHGIFLDVGAILDAGDSLSAGLTLQNLGAVSYGTAPVTAAGGIYAKMLDDEINSLNLAVEVKYGIGGELEISGGAEYSFAGSLFLRSGYGWQSNYRSIDGALSGVSAGVGVKFQSFSIDYSVSFNGGLGVYHIFSLKLVKDMKSKT